MYGVVGQRQKVRYFFLPTATVVTTGIFVFPKKIDYILTDRHYRRCSRSRPTRCPVTEIKIGDFNLPDYDHRSHPAAVAQCFIMQALLWRPPILSASPVDRLHHTEMGGWRRSSLSQLLICFILQSFLHFLCFLLKFSRCRSFCTALVLLIRLFNFG